MSKYTWLLDPGHGGLIDDIYQTASKRSPKFPDGSVLYEGEFNRAIVKQILKLSRSKFCGNGNIKIIDVLNGSQEDMPLRQRVSIANEIHKEENNCIYVSIHANAFGNGKDFNQAKGVCTFYHYRSSKGKTLATTLQKHLGDFTPLHDRGIRSNDTWANFYVLRKTHMPAVLSENGFMTNFDDAIALMDPTVRKQIAAAHFGMIQEIEENGL